MPNWCSNTLVVHGEPDDVQFLLDAVAGPSTRFSLNSVIKMPPALEDRSAPEKDEAVKEENLRLYGAADWYDWKTSNWGTKWDVTAHIIHDKTQINMPGLRTVKFAFDSAWAPPIPVIKTLAERFPNTNILHTWDESGMDFSGWSVYAGGKERKTVHLEQSWYTIEQMFSADIPEDIFERYQNE